MKRFVYLVQSKNNQLPEAYGTLACEDADLITLTWATEQPGCLYLPGSTWTQGRNRLLAEARAAGRPEYLYYIFLDDDLILRRGGWREFESRLLEYEPAVATPYCRDYRRAFLSPDLEVQRCLEFDAMCNAFHRELILDEIVLPYYPGLDDQSWWFSQWFVIELAHLFYHDHILQINTVHLNNGNHGDYPKAGILEAARPWFFGEVIRSWSYPWRALLPHEWIVGLQRRFRRWRWRKNRRFLPAPKRRMSYTLSEAAKRCALHLDADFWRERSF